MNSVYIVWREWSDGYDHSKHMIGVFKTEPLAEDHAKDARKLLESEYDYTQYSEIDYWIEEVEVME